MNAGERHRLIALADFTAKALTLYAQDLRAVRMPTMPLEEILGEALAILKNPDPVTPRCASSDTQRETEML